MAMARAGGEIPRLRCAIRGWRHFRKTAWDITCSATSERTSSHCPAKRGCSRPSFFHDLGHVLTGYHTDAPGEIQMTGFEAGYMREDGFSAVMLGLILFHYGMRPQGSKPRRPRVSSMSLRFSGRISRAVACSRTCASSHLAICRAPTRAVQTLWDGVSPARNTSGALRLRGLCLALSLAVTSLPGVNSGGLTV